MAPRLAGLRGPCRRRSGAALRHVLVPDSEPEPAGGPAGRRGGPLGDACALDHRRASYLASFALHDEFQVERMEDGGKLPPDNFGLTLDDPTSSSEETDAYTDDEAGLDNTDILVGPKAVMKEPVRVQPVVATA